MFETNVKIQGEYYGVSTYDKEKEAYVFHKVGKLVKLKDIETNIESGENFLLLSWVYQGKTKIVRLERQKVFDQKQIGELTGKGADIPSSKYNTFLDSIRIQEHIREKNNKKAKAIYSHLGWIDVQSFDKTGTAINNRRFFRYDTLIGSNRGMYKGDFDIKKRGSFEKWKSFITKDVVGNAPLELVLIASLSAIPNACLCDFGIYDNPIIHLNAPSGTGKTTVAYLATSVYGKPYESTSREYDENGQLVLKKSLYQSWGATENALIGRLSGNCGVVTVLNELSKFVGRNMSRIIMDFSEGSDKARLNAPISERFSTVVISTGESSLLDKCDSKLEGLNVRVMEINDGLTKDADHSNRIKRMSTENCGYAAPLLAEHILNNGGSDYVYSIYCEHKEKLIAETPLSYNSTRFIETFSARFLATAEIASSALGINFDIEGIKKYLLNYEKENASKRNTSAESYEKIIEECKKNSSKFFKRFGKGQQTKFIPSANVNWGRITSCSYTFNDKQVVEEIEVYPSVVKEILKSNGFTNIETCVKAWKESGVIDFEGDRNHHRRCLDPNSGSKDKVFVFRVFETSDDGLQTISEEVMKA